MAKKSKKRCKNCKRLLVRIGDRWKCEVCDFSESFVKAGIVSWAAPWVK